MDWINTNFGAPMQLTIVQIACVHVLSFKFTLQALASYILVIVL